MFNKVPHRFREIGNRLYTLDWTPIKPGPYDVDVKYGDVIPVWGSPMKFKAYDSTKVKYLDMGYKAEIGERHLMKCKLKSVILKISLRTICGSQDPRLFNILQYSDQVGVSSFLVIYDVTENIQNVLLFKVIGT